jgi:hypothetical protein
MVQDFLIAHSHGLSGGISGSGTLYTNYTNPSHSHNIYLAENEYASNNIPEGTNGGSAAWRSGYISTTNINHRHSIGSHGHSHTLSVNSNGVSGSGKNKPAYYSLIFIIKMS